MGDVDASRLLLQFWYTSCSIVVCFMSVMQEYLVQLGFAQKVCYLLKLFDELHGVDNWFILRQRNFRMSTI